MKILIKFLTINYLLFCVIDDAHACYEPWYSPAEMNIYRVYDEKNGSKSELDGFNPGSDVNCLEWQKLTSSTIPLDDIYTTVYKIPLAEFEKIANSRDISRKNKFLEWITTQDWAIFDFLLLAKKNEYIRFHLNSKWHYPKYKGADNLTLETIVEESLNAKDKRLRDRYLLQAVRALFSMKRYKDCIDIWYSEASLLPKENIMRQLIEPYIEGAESRVNRSEKNSLFFAERGDIQSLLYCEGLSGKNTSELDALELVCKYAPNSNYIAKKLQQYIPSFDVNRVHEYNRLHSLCMKMGKNKKCNQRGMWYYTASYLADKQGNSANASILLDLAEDAESNSFHKESIMLFRLYLDAKKMKYNKKYEEKLFGQLKWLDSMIVNNITPEVIEETAHAYKLMRGVSYYYWNDMLRKIVLGEIYPKMIKAGKTTRALQLANMADNRLFNIVNQRYVDCYSDGKHSVKKYTMAEYRYSDHFNDYDYKNSFFVIIDNIGLDNAIEYVENVNKSKDPFDIFLNRRGYTSSNYLNDILGTQCLRNCRYEEAVYYLGKVSKYYKAHLNVEHQFNPFNINYEKTTATSDNFRYDFALKMRDLERTIEHTSDVNLKAEAMFEYGIGLKNSFFFCWELTQYYYGKVIGMHFVNKCNWKGSKEYKTANKKSQDMIRNAINTASDDELAANLLYKVSNFKRIAEEYPKTKKGRLVRSKCDNLRDYRKELN